MSEIAWRDPDSLSQFLDDNLGDWATKNVGSDERLHDACGAKTRRVPSSDVRTPFQHDRDRIIHSRAFRRLRGKTQVFLAIKGDHYRSRLSHTLEVAQLGRTIARRLRLNEDLTEAIALGHDLGHTPFGHAGESALNSILRGHQSDISNEDNGGFKHNFHSLYVVDTYEQAYTEFTGLNLTSAVREGIWKHTDIRKNGQLRVNDPRLSLSDLNPTTDPATSLEGQVVAVADEIAQITHDLEDGFRAGILSERILSNWADRFKAVRAVIRFSDTSFKNSAEVRSTLIVHLISYLVGDVVKQTSRNLVDVCPRPSYSTELVRFSNQVAKDVIEMKDALYTEVLLDSDEVRRMDAKARFVVQKLFKAYLEYPGLIPSHVLRKHKSNPGTEPILNRAKRGDATLREDEHFHRLIADHIAGMTDAYALEEYRRIYQAGISLILDE